jgi:hypothetical protein
MKSGRNSSHRSHYFVAVLLFLLVATAALSLQTPQSSAMTPEERRARAAIEKYVVDGPAKDYLQTVIDGLNALPSRYDGAKPGFNRGMADSLEYTANLKRDNPGIRITNAQNPTFTSTAIQIDLQVRAASQDPMQSPDSSERQKAKASIDRIDAAAKRFAANRGPHPSSDFIKAADATSLMQEPAPRGEGKKYDPTKSVGLQGPGYREMLKTAAPIVDHLLANANFDQIQAQNAAALERAATINNTLESARKMPDLVVKSVAFEARTLSAEGLETMRGELQKLVRLGNPNVDSDEVNGAIDTVIAAAKNGVNPNSPSFENASAALKGYVSAALHNAEIGGPGAPSPEAGRKGGVQQNLNRR